MTEATSDSLLPMLLAELERQPAAPAGAESVALRAARIVDRLRAVEAVLPTASQTSTAEWPGAHGAFDRLRALGWAEQGDAEPPPGARRILFVDDHEDTCDLFQELLQLEGHAVTVGRNGVDAVLLLLTRTFDVAILDIGLPEIDGETVARVAKRILGADAPQLVAMTGYVGTEDREQARRAGFDLHLAKPVPAAQLLETVRRAKPD